ncbi:MAG: TolC family protein [Pelagibacterales bacterium]|nr:TolC family protein [Pelagibacterales bacterium]
MLRLFIILLLLSETVFSQNDLVSLSIDEAIEYGIKNNRNLMNAEREILMAYNQKWETIATGLPQITANLDYSNYIELPTSLIPLEKFGGPPGEFSEVQFGLEQSAFGSMRMEQQIFDGSWIVGLQATKIYLETSKNFYEKTLLQVREGVVKLYSLVSILKEGVRLLENNVENFKKDYYEISELYNNGFEEIENVEQIKITLAQSEFLLKQTEKTYDNQKELLKLILGIKLDDQLVLTTDVEKFISGDIVFNKSIVDFIPENNIDIKISKNAFETKKLEYKLEQSKRLPKIKGFYSNTFTGYNDDFKFLQSDQKWFGSSVFGINLKVPIFTSLGLRASSQKAKYAMDNAETSYVDQKERTRALVKQKLNDYLLALDSYNIDRENMMLSISIEEKNSIKFFEGMVSSFELRQAQNQLLNAQQKYLNSVINLISIYAELETLFN